MTHVITGFNRDRDSYQVPLAVAEAGDRLTLVTDYYRGASWPRFKSLEHRYNVGIAPRDVSTVRQALFLQIAHRAASFLGLEPSFPSDRIDKSIGDRVRDLAKGHPDATLLLYSNYAAEAFALDDRADRILFQYHPGRSAVEAGLNSDETGGEFDWPPEPEQASAFRQKRYWQEIQGASKFVVASSFTKRGLIIDGIPEDRIHVVPYGCPDPSPATATTGAARAPVILFVGQGVHRKGLHILAKAWAEVDNPEFELRIVTNNLNPVIESLLRALKNVTVLTGLSNRDVKNEMLAADTLVLPSLVEGFGLVLGEALGSGCRLLASTNTGLPDLQLPEPLGFVVDAGDVGALGAGIRQVMVTFDPQGGYREKIVAQAAARTWSKFRDGVRGVYRSEISSS